MYISRFLLGNLSHTTIRQVKQDQLFVVVLTDYTKAGVLTTQTLNKHSSLMAKLTSRNQRRNSSNLQQFFL